MILLFLQSHPVRGAWIEIENTAVLTQSMMSHPVRGAWIEIRLTIQLLNWLEKSHPVRGAWIEISDKGTVFKLNVCRIP